MSGSAKFVTWAVARTLPLAVVAVVAAVGSVAMTLYAFSLWQEPPFSLPRMAAVGSATMLGKTAWELWRFGNRNGGRSREKQL